MVNSPLPIHHSPYPWRKHRLEHNAELMTVCDPDPFCHDLLRGKAPDLVEQHTVISIRKGNAFAGTGG